MTNTATVWEVPQPASTLEVPVAGNAVITLRRHGNPTGPRLILSHGNGLAIDLYYPFWSLLADEFDLILYDLRNHGWNGTGSLKNHNLPTIVEDLDLILEAVDLHYGKKPMMGVFHSVSALATLLSPTYCGRYSALVLFDPPLCKPGATYDEFDAAATRSAAMARRRTELFPTREAFSELFQYLPTFRQVVPGVHDLIAQTTLRACTDHEGFVLCCPPDYEAQIIDFASVYAVSVSLDKLRCPTKVIGADPTLPFSYLPTFDLGELLEVDYDFLPDTTHFLQLEQPHECATALREFLEEQGYL